MLMIKNCYCWVVVFWCIDVIKPVQFEYQLFCKKKGVLGLLKSDFRADKQQKSASAVGVINYEI